MARRNKSPLEELLAQLIPLPPWVSLGMAALSYGLLEWLKQAYPLSPKQPLSMLIQGVPSWIPCLPFGITALLSASHRLRRGKLVDEQTGLASLRETTWKDFEILVAEAYRREGYAVDYSMDSGPDGGVDILLRRGGQTSLVQCKRWRQMSVGVTVIREMFGLLHAHQAHHAIIVTTGRFTSEAHAFARGKPITLIGGNELWAMVKEVQKEPLTMLEVSAPQPPRSLPPAPAFAEETASPHCPRCAGPMVRRRAKRGAHAGQAFWGCPRFPDCRGTLPLIGS